MSSSREVFQLRHLLNRGTGFVWIPDTARATLVVLVAVLVQLEDRIAELDAEIIVSGA